MKARLEKRRIVNYKDMANVVERSEEFEFLKGTWHSCAVVAAKMLSLYQNRSEKQEDKSSH